MRTTDAPVGEQGEGRRRSRDIGGTGPGSGGSATGGGGTRPLAGAALLERLRVTGRARPAADPMFAGDLRSYLEDAVAGVDRGCPPLDAARSVVTHERLERALSCPPHRPTDRSTERTFTVPLACGALVGALFRQLVTVGAIADPMADALEALSLDDRQAPLVDWIEGLVTAERAELGAEVGRQARGLVERWPTLESSWLPRTDETLRVPLRDGIVELTTRVDLAIGRPAGGEATVALVDVASGVRRPGHRDDRAVDALVETLRTSVPPFVVATYYTRTGELDVEPVTRELLVAAARRCAAGIRALLDGRPGSDDGTWCATCATLLQRPPVALSGGAAARPVPAPAAASGPVAPVVDLPREQAA